MTIAIVNPLPAALAHYADELAGVIRAAGEQPQLLPTPSIERLEGTSVLTRTSRSLRWRRSFRPMTEDAVVVWPAFGYLDPLTLQRSSARTWLVVHDPVPLRRQFGLGSVASHLGRRGLRSRLTVLVHSSAAQIALADRGWPARRVLHPTLPPAPASEARGDQVRVLGQWKPARSLDALVHLSSAHEWDRRREICGRGWPEVSGWEVDSRFLDEIELDDRISDSVAVVLPYTRYFQSGIAVRCLERGVPVVGRPNPFLAELYGEDWPGIVRDGDWAAAVQRAAAISSDAIRDLHARYWSACVEQWTRVFERVNPDGAAERA